MLIQKMSTKTKIEEIKDMFMIFDDPMDKYMQIIELGKKNPGIEENDKNDKNRIYGCTSLAWVKVIKNKNKYNILIDSDTFIVKGLLSILKYIIDESTEDEIFYAIRWNLRKTCCRRTRKELQAISSENLGLC